MTIAPETARSKTRVARKVYKYRDAELARLTDPPPPPPPCPLPPPPPLPGNVGEVLGEDVVEDVGNDMMIKDRKQEPA
jgi:hypothetical protein